MIVHYSGGTVPCTCGGTLAYSNSAEGVGINGHSAPFDPFREHVALVPGMGNVRVGQ